MKIWLFVLVSTGSLAVGFGSGFLIGRFFPAHHFEHVAGGPDYMLLDTATGKPCMTRRVMRPPANPYTKYLNPGYLEDMYPDVPTCGS